ncbi:hypothetical protein [Microbacterium sp. PA5]|uniref:hypothetical protein n=1 Tax=Microbacterium sp. PA5 TaxID=3416654 RepID=UPI003CE95A41
MADGVELATAWVRLVPSVEGITDQVVKSVGGSEMENAGKQSGKKWSAGAKAAMAVGAAAITAGVVKVFTTGVEELKFGEKVSAQTDVLIKNTGFAMATSQIEDYTLSLSQLSGISEEDLQAAGNSILKFGDISEENYKKAVASVNDLAATGKDASGVAEGLGKALADPATAAGKLRRMGISLTEQQQEQIKAMTKAGDTAGAQKVILDSLESTYGGMAEAAGGTLEGNLNKLNNSWENLAGAAVESLMPAIEGVVGMLQGFVGWISENEAVMPILIGALGFLAVAFVGVTVATWAMNTALLANPITWIILGILALIAALVLLIMNWDAVVAWVTDVWGGFMGWLETVIDGFVSWWGSTWNAVGAWIKGVWDGFTAWVTTLWTAFIVWLFTMGVRISNWWNGLWSSIGKWISDVWNGIVNGVTNYFTTLWNGLVSVGRSISNWWNGLWSGISDFFGGIWDGILNAVESVGRAFRDIFDGVRGFIENAFKGVLGVVKAPLNGIIGLVNSAIRAVNGISVTIPDWVPIVGGQTWGLSLPTIPMLAAGATIMPRAGGTLAVLAEAGRPESVVDTGLMNRALEEGLSGSGRGETFILRAELTPERGTPLAVQVDRAAQRLASKRGFVRMRSELSEVTA